MDTRELAGKLGLAWSDWWMGGSGGIGVVGGKPVFSHARRSERSADLRLRQSKVWVHEATQTQQVTSTPLIGKDGLWPCIVLFLEVL